MKNMTPHGITGLEKVNTKKGEGLNCNAAEACEITHS
jgi:hypothetical protein